jgi:hypothetical protein
MKNIVITRDLNLAPHATQITALDLMRMKLLHKEGITHTAPRRFMFIVLISDDVRGPPYLTPHLVCVFNAKLKL